MGVTHLSIALCSFCGSRAKKKTAYLELHKRNEISQLYHERLLFDSRSRGPERTHFTLHGADYYPCVESREIPSLMNSGYDYLILDTGSLKEADCSELLRCDRKLVLGSLAPWKIKSCQEFFLQFDTTVNLGEGFCYLVQAKITGNIPDFIKTTHISMQSIPFISNPFRIRKECFTFLEELTAV